MRIPYADMIPPRARIRAWETRELDGMDGPMRRGHALAAEICRQLEEDILLCEHKIPRLESVLCAGDKGIMQFRRWSKQLL